MTMKLTTELRAYQAFYKQHWEYANEYVTNNNKGKQASHELIRAL